MRNQDFNILCYADDVVLIANSEDNLQRLLHKFNTTSKKFNMIISAEKTKCLTISKEPIRCKLETNGRIIEQTMTFNYLGVEITSHRDLYRETTNQVRKLAVVSGALKNIIWRNKYLRKETKTRIYKTCVRPILTYAIEIRTDTKRTKQALRTAEMNILRPIVGKNKKRSHKECKHQKRMRYPGYSKMRTNQKKKLG
ncbi:hypothetical protein M0802_014287 [Mischocyttarus mexicanus]|nr:hypothetical protein M0802_014287 [Mischocyttarus mexicanus]